MIDPRHIELIHKDIDGLLTPEDRLHLNEVLAASEEAKRLHQELSAMDALLAQEPASEPPA